MHVVAGCASGSVEIRRHRGVQGAESPAERRVVLRLRAAAPDGWWLRTVGGIYLWTPRTGAVLIADIDATPAGACA
jgi:hypothetical protein